MNSEIQLFDDGKINILKNMYFKGLTDNDLEVFLHICKRTALDPFARQIYAVKRKEKKPDGSWGEALSIQTGIDGYRLIAERTGKYAPGREPSFTYDKDQKILSATSYVKKQTNDGTWHEVACTAFWNEYVQKRSDGSPTQFWQKMGHNQLAKCAEALALRKAFPGDLSGIYTKEEMDQADIEVYDCPQKEHSKETPVIAPSDPLAANLVIEKKSPQIEHELARQLMNLSKKCDPEYVEKVLEYLKTKGIDGFINVTEKEYNKVKIGLEKNSELFKKEV